MANQPPPSYYVQPRELPPDERMNPWVLRLLLLGFTGALLLLFSLVALIAGYQFMTQDQIYQGVSPVYGVNISGMTRAEAESALAERVTYGDLANFTFTLDDQTWTFSGQQIGVDFDISATVANAFAVGRRGNPAENLLNQWRTWRDGHPIAPVITYNQSQALEQIQRLAETEINQPLVEASLTFNEGQVFTSESQTGRELDSAATLAALEAAIFNLQTEVTIPLQVTELRPSLSSLAVESAAEKLEIALDPAGVTFMIPPQAGADAGPWVARPESIENMLRVEQVENEDGTFSYNVNVTLSQARDFLTGLSAELTRPASNARFEFNPNTGELRPIESSINGRRLNVEATLARFSEAVFNPDDRTVPLVFEQLIPTVHNNAKAEDLGIRELIAESTTYYIGSTPSRRSNIQLAASRFHGIVIAPGEEFSFNRFLGDVDQNEFEEALIIVGDQTVTGVGGGICQVSTTAFQAAFYAGFPILERYAHGYRVEYYEVGEGVGMDAAIYSPLLDFRFRNDTPHHLLIETYVRPADTSITFRFYSTNVGRRVVREGPVIRNETPAPSPVYRANAELRPGEVVQTDWPQNGLEVSIYRTIYENDQIVVDKEEFYSRYVPWPAQFQVAPGDARLGS